MVKDKPFEFLDHTADVLVRAYGRTFEEALCNIAIGMFEIMTDTSGIESKVSVKLQVCGYDLENLVYRWLEELLYYHDAYNYVFSKFEIESIKETVIDNEKSICIEALARGEPFDRLKHEPRTVVKAVTYHQMRIARDGERWVIEVVFDI